MLAAASLALAASSSAQTVSFRKQVAPIFASACTACHGASNPQSALDLHTFAALMKGGRRGKAIVAGQPAKSLLVQYIDGSRQPRMPIGGALKPGEIALIRRWIAEGARSDGDLGGPPPIPKIRVTARVLPQAASLAWSKDGKWLAVGTYQVVRIMDPVSGETLRTLPGHADVIRALAFSSDGSALACGGGVPGVGGEVKLWNAATGALIRTLTGHTDCIYSLAWRPDGKQIATTSYDKTVRLWDVEKGRSTAELKEHAEAVYACAYSASGKFLATASADKSIRVWDPSSGRRLYTLAGHTEAVTSLAFHPTANEVASGSADKSVRTWALNADSGSNNRTYGGLSDGVTDVRYSPDGKLLAATLGNGDVPIWDLGKNALARTIKSGDDSALSLAVRPDNAVVAVGGYDGSVKLFHVVDGKLSATLIAAPKRAAASK